MRSVYRKAENKHMASERNDLISWQ